jgi:hypothetical protein
MSTSVRVQLNKAGVRQLARSEGMQKVVDHFAHKIRDGAGEGFVVNSRTGKNRARAVVIAASWDANAAERKNRVLTRAVQAARTK